MNTRDDRLVIFDCDGVLVDSEFIQARAFSDVLKDFNVDLDPEKGMRDFKGLNLAGVIETIERQFEVKLPEDFGDIYRAQMRKLFETDLQPIAGIHEVLENLKLPKCVASNGPQNKMQQTLGVTGLLKYFPAENIFSGYDIDDFKPSPGLYVHAAKQMGFPADKCVVLEDSVTGLQAALAAGMRVVYYNSNADFSGAEKVGVKECISNAKDFLELL